MAVGVEIPKESGSDSAHLGMAPLQHWGAFPAQRWCSNSASRLCPGKAFGTEKSQQQGCRLPMAPSSPSDPQNSPCHALAMLLRVVESLRV